MHPKEQMYTEDLAAIMMYMQISGAGQIVGERDFLASKAHSTTLVAETEGTAIAIPAHAVRIAPVFFLEHR